MWALKRSRETPKVITCDPFGIDEALRSVSLDPKSIAVVDCPPHAVAGTTRLLASVDHIVVPVQPTMPDLAATQRTVNMVKAAGTPFSFVLSRAPIRSSEESQALNILESFGPTAPVVIHDRRAYARALIHSAAVTEIARQDHSKASEEINALWRWLNQRIKELGDVQVQRQSAAIC